GHPRGHQSTSMPGRECSGDADQLRLEHARLLEGPELQPGRAGTLSAYHQRRNPGRFGQRDGQLYRDPYLSGGEWIHGECGGLRGAAAAYIQTWNVNTDDFDACPVGQDCSGHSAPGYQLQYLPGFGPTRTSGYRTLGNPVGSFVKCTDMGVSPPSSSTSRPMW